MLLIDKVIGAGEIEISDHRSSHPDIEALLLLASKVYMGGLIGGKPGLLHLHLGEGKGGLSILNELTQKSDLPVELFLPTHVNRTVGESFQFAFRRRQYDALSGLVHTTSSSGGFDCNYWNCSFYL